MIERGAKVALFFIFYGCTHLGRVFSPLRSPPAPHLRSGLKKGGEIRQSPPVLLEVLGKQSYTQNSSAF
jgi:hypothetical protein